MVEYQIWNKWRPISARSLIQASHIPSEKLDQSMAMTSACYASRNHTYWVLRAPSIQILHISASQWASLAVRGKLKARLKKTIVQTLKKQISGLGKIACWCSHLNIDPWWTPFQSQKTLNMSLLKVNTFTRVMYGRESSILIRLTSLEVLSLSALTRFSSMTICGIPLLPPPIHSHTIQPSHSRHVSDLSLQPWTANHFSN